MIGKKVAIESIKNIVPVSVLAKDLPCWKEGGRKGCAKDKAFKELEGDVFTKERIHTRNGG